MNVGTMNSMSMGVLTLESSSCIGDSTIIYCHGIFQWNLFQVGILWKGVPH